MVFCRLAGICNHMIYRHSLETRVSTRTHQSIWKQALATTWWWEHLSHQLSSSSCSYYHPRINNTLNLLLSSFTLLESSSTFTTRTLRCLPKPFIWPLQMNSHLSISRLWANRLVLQRGLVLMWALFVALGLILRSMYVFMMTVLLFSRTHCY